MAVRNDLLNINTPILNDINIAVFRSTPGADGRFLEVNSTILKVLGFSDKNAFLQKVRPSDIYFYPQQRDFLSKTLMQKGFIKSQEFLMKKRDGTTFYAKITAVVVKDPKGKIKWFDGVVEDVTTAKREQERFRYIFEHVPVAIWEEDFSAVAKLRDKLQTEKVKDIKRYLYTHPEVVISTFRKIRILDLNKAAIDIYGAASKGELISHFGKTIAKVAIDVLVDEFSSLMSGDKYFETDLRSRTLQGKYRDVRLRASVPDGYEKTFSRIIVTLEDITEQKRLEKHLKLMAQQGALTKLLNMRAITNRLEEELIRAKRYNLDLSCMMLDLDYFKVINDKYGHQKGNLILKRISQLIRRSIRRSDVVGRYGGDEFFFILTQTNVENAKFVANRISKLISGEKFTVLKGANFRLTASIGISGYPHYPAKDFRELITQADRAMYTAKSSGRDCVIVS